MVIQPRSGIGGSEGNGQGLIWINNVLSLNASVSMDIGINRGQKLYFSLTNQRLSFYSEYGIPSNNAAIQLNAENRTYYWVCLLQ